MPWVHWKRKKNQTMRVAKLHFLGEQDGPHERELKDQLGKFFQTNSTVKTAYLVRVAYEHDSAPNVALCLRVDATSSASLQAHHRKVTVVKSVANIFASMFGSHEHMDVMFLDERQEAELSQVCRAFYVSSTHNS